MQAEFVGGAIVAEMAPFWAALQEKKFVLLQCAECGSWYWPFSACRNHANKPYFSNMQWKPASGKGKILTYTRPEWTFHPAFPAPFVYAIVELDEGPVMPSNIVGCDPKDVKIGMAVSVVYENLTPDIVVPKFQPAK
jgi:uncharacterized OB-fold protein